MTLTEDGADVTVLKYAAKADVGGKIAQLGSRLIASTSKKLAGEFFSTFNAKVSGGESAARFPLPAVSVQCEGLAPCGLEHDRRRGLRQNRAPH